MRPSPTLQATSLVNCSYLLWEMVVLNTVLADATTEKALCLNSYFNIFLFS